MATGSKPLGGPQNEYPSGDGRPIGETPTHAQNILYSIHELKNWFADNPRVYVSGNNLMYYVPGDKHTHVSPDVFVVQGIVKDKRRDYYLTWEEGAAPHLVIEVTSRSTRKEDLKKKLALYRDVLRVREYFLFDPFGEYLDPKLQGHRLVQGQYLPIEPVAGRLPSEVLSLHLEAADEDLRFWDPLTSEWLPNPHEAVARVEQKAEADRQKAEVALQAKDAEIARLQRELDAARRGGSP
ncbi:MAG: Uma2 family endonuclease [Pirellulales bacterium]